MSEHKLSHSGDLSMLQETHRLAAAVFGKRNTNIAIDCQTKHTPLFLTPHIQCYSHTHSLWLVSCNACEQKYTLSIKHLLVNNVAHAFHDTKTTA